MTRLGGRKYPSDWDAPLEVEVQTNHGPQPWHAKARKLRMRGETVRDCAKMCGVSFGRMQRFLNPDSKKKAKKRQSAWAKERRANDPEYAEKMRSYIRRYMQLSSGGRRKN